MHWSSFCTFLSSFKHQNGKIFLQLMGLLHSNEIQGPLELNSPIVFIRRNSGPISVQLYGPTDYECKVVIQAFVQKENMGQPITSRPHVGSLTFRCTPGPSSRSVVPAPLLSILSYKSGGHNISFSLECTRMHRRIASHCIEKEEL